MMARPFCAIVVLLPWLLLLPRDSGFAEGASNPGFVARITRKGLEYARQYAVATLRKELSDIHLPDFSGHFKAGWIGRVSYDFHSLKVHYFKLQNSDLSLLPELGIRASLSKNYMSVGGNWKVKKAFITLQGTFDLKVDDIFISVSLRLGKDSSGQPTAFVASCTNSIGRVSVDISGSLSWILNLFHERIENNIKNTLENKICTMVRKSADSYLSPYLRTLPVTSRINQVAGIDYRLVGAPQVTSEGVDVPFKGEFFSLGLHAPPPFEAPAMSLPQQHNHMVYFAVSEYVFNTASWVYHQAGLMKIVIGNEQLKSLTKLAASDAAKRWQRQNGKPSCLTSRSTPLTSLMSCFSGSFLLALLQAPLGFPLQLSAGSLQGLLPQLSRLYPNTEVELEASPESEPFLTFTPGNVTLMPVMDIQAFALLPNSSDRKLLFQLRAKTNISITIRMNGLRLLGSVTTGSKLKLELKHSNISYINVGLMETIFNYYAVNLIYPALNAKLEEGFPLPLPRNTFLNSVELQIHKNFLLLGANID